ncbi:FERM and PDZ domain-containing protein 2 [Cottoperca gobio]|uniref:FERM and PDZ domain-containing protein 2 n=1 Tax=Cottoperca gobio TaxID=56716 RepID=A0A6J2RN40_COTGO|nr:FERM and PDZ domain-containing protein 2-like [Cottoperca gobio]
MGTFVTLAEVLEARGSPLDEDEVWCLLLATTDALLDIYKKGSSKMCSVLSPGSVLLSANGSLAFKSCARHENVASFTAPEAQQGHTATTRTAAEKMVVYSLGMTLYWCVDYHLPQNQPVQLSPELVGLLLSMCEDMVVRRTDLLTVQDTCELHHRASVLPPAERLVRQLVEDVYRNSVDHVSMAENGSRLTDRSQMVRDRLHRGSFSNSTCALKKKISRTFSGASYPCEPTGIPSGGRHIESYGSWQQLNRGPCSPYVDGNRIANSRSLAQFESSMSLNDKRVKDMGPEFIRMLDEPMVVLELPGSIVSKKGKSPTTQREISVLMPNGQSILVKCEVKSRGGDVFDMIVAHSNLVEHFYFGLAYIDDNEFFFVDNDTKISKVAPDSWKKVPTTTFVLFFRVKFFVNDISHLHKQTRHQYYLQLRRDLLEDRLSCHEETALYLGALALQTECGDCMPEVYGRNYYRPDQYVSKSVMEKRALPYIQGELLRLHTNNAQMLTDESELEFFKVCQQLPEYGVFLHRVMREKKPLEGEIILGVCAKGVIIYEVKDGCRSTTQTFYWRETATISSNRRKFVVESRGSKKKYNFITERSKIATYLCNLCSAQHKFNNEMNSRQLSQSLVSEENTEQYAVCRSQSSRLKSFSCSETPQDDSGLTTPRDESLNKLCDDIADRIETRFKLQRLNEQSTSSSQLSSHSVRSPACSQKSGSEGPSGSTAPKETKPRSSSEREVICVSLKKDPKFGLGILIVGEDTVGHYDLGIFVASIVPGGPADKDGRIRAGGRLISLNHISLEGVTFSEAAEVMQSSPEEVQLIISQPKVPTLSPNSVRSPVFRSYECQTTLMTDGRSVDDSLDEIVSVMMTPKTSNRLHVPRDVRAVGTQDSCSLSPSLNCVRPSEITVEIRKISGSLGVSIAGGVNTNLPNGGLYIKSLVPGGAAEREGHVHAGDRLLEVDGVSFQGFTYQQAVQHLSKTGEVVTLVVERVLMNQPRVSLRSDTISNASNQSVSPATSPLRINNCSSSSTSQNTISDQPRGYSFVTDGNTQEVTLTKNAHGLGFSFLMCELDPPTRDFGSLVRIKELFPGQPAQQSGRILEGDVLLAINGQSLKELSYPRVLKLFKTSPPEVRLTLSRPAQGSLPSIDQFIGT